jgi:hypothetical protein
MPDAHPIESFLAIPDFPGYRASDRGRVQSCWKRGRRPALTDCWRDMKPRTHKAGYHYVTLSRDGGEFRRFVHEIVLTTFAGPCPDGLLCRHLNGDPANNRWPENICWGTYQENAADTRRHGRMMIGETHYAAKVTSNAVREIRRMASEGMTHREIGEIVGLHPTSVGDIVRRRNWASVS